MERDIKFRAWDTYEKRIHQDIGSGIYQEPDEIYPFHKILEYPRYEVMQYTGLKDKNDKEIYEGDIIATNRWKSFDEKRYVSFNKGSFTVTNIPLLNQQHNTFSIYNSDTLRDWEVIGNTYENPELLKAEAN